MPRRICVVVTSRASYARIKSVLAAIDRHPDCELQLVAAGSLLLEKAGRAINVIEGDGFTPAARIFMVIEGENPTTMAKTTGLSLLELPTVLNSLAPDAVLTIADRFETLATAVAASYMNIPLAHVQGGEITGSIDEKVRHAVTKLSDLHFVANTACADRLVRMGEDPQTVFVTGCPSIDLASQVLAAPQDDRWDPMREYGGVGGTLDLAAPYLVAVQHPVTTEYDQALSQVWTTLEAVYELGVPTLWFWPNIDAGSDKLSKGIRIFRERYNPDFIHFFKNMQPEDFLRLLCRARCIVGNSSVGIRECAFLGLPAVNIGNRQQGRERAGNVTDVPYDKERIKAAVLNHLQNGRYPSSHIYGGGDAGTRIADLLARAELRVEKGFYTGT